MANEHVLSIYHDGHENRTLSLATYTSHDGTCGENLKISDSLKLFKNFMLQRIASRIGG
jgi:hypothetical protein